MADHKFKPKDWVLVRDYEEAPWWLAVYSHYSAESIHKHKMADGQSGFHQCIPYTPETAHLLGTSQPYEPPKPPVDESKRFKCGEWVEVLHFEKWVKALFLFYNGVLHCAFVPSGNKPADTFDPDQIRPLPDDTAAH